MNSGVESSASPRFLRCALSAVRRNVMVATPGISSGYWNARKMPLAARSSGGSASMSSPSSSTVARGHHVAVLAGEHMRERRFAGAVRAHDGVHVPFSIDQSRGLEDLLALDFDVEVLDFKQHVFQPDLFNQRPRSPRKIGICTKHEIAAPGRSKLSRMLSRQDFERHVLPAFRGNQQTFAHPATRTAGLCRNS